MSLHVAVVIVGYRNVADVVRCVASLEKSTHRDFEILVCENGGREAFQALQSSIPDRLDCGQPARLIEAPSNVGYAGGVNIGISASKDADAWWILNPDTEVNPDAMAALVAHHLRGYDAVGAAIHFPSGEVQTYGGIWLAWAAKAVSIGFGSSKGNEPAQSYVELRQNYLSGASMFVGQRFVQAVGPMSERFFLYCEEIEWFLRAKSRGMRLGFAPGAVVIHHGGTATGYSRVLRARSVRSVFLDERNKMLLTRDLYPSRLPIAGTLALCRLIGRYARKGAFPQIVFGTFGWFTGLCGRSGIPNWIQKESQGDTKPA
jgi:GT2 family glycosyltransferase